MGLVVRTSSVDWGGHYVKYGSADMQVECDDGSIMKEGFGGCAFLNENGIEWHS